MPDVLSTFIVLLILLFASTISTATGFGAAVIAIPLCSLFVDVKLVIPLLALVSVITCVYMTVREHGQADGKELRRILLWGGLGFPAGNLAYHFLPIAKLEFLLGIFVTGVAVHGLWRLYRRRPRRPWNPVAGRAFLVTGGLIQGALAAGGPMIVTYAHHTMPEKGRFRATLFVVWVVFNTVFLASYFAGPNRQMTVLLLGACSIPSIAGGIWLGQKLHRWASDVTFQLLVSATLLLSGISLLAR